MNDIQKNFYNTLIGAISIKNEITDSEVEFYVNQFKKLPMFNMLSEEEVEIVKNKIITERTITLDYGSFIEGNYKHKKWFLSKKSDLEMKYWNRYRNYLLYKKNFPINVVNTMDDVLDELTDFLGNPIIEKSYQRRGLVVGDVQSGKTSNYTGLICKAADAGYKVIVVLTGTIEKLRKQTQMRLDEGFLGVDSASMRKNKEDIRVGVGILDFSLRPITLTSTIDDFQTQKANGVVLDLQTLNQPVLFVIKKNVTSLKNLNKWLKMFNSTGEEKIKTSLLLVDDESDNASVNTNPEDGDPTSINKQIRELLYAFTKSSYVGFTATPFANIFIDPDTNDDMLKEDLFPKDYIYSLNAPTNYIGARDIFDEKGEYSYMLQEIDVDEVEECLPAKHKKDYHLEYIPSDLKEAICTFLLANVIRDLRGDNKTHRSMLINISRFNEVQQEIFEHVNEYLKAIQSSVKLYSSLDEHRALKDKYIKSLKEVFNKQYKDKEFKWNDVYKNLSKSISPITVLVANQKTKKVLNYEDYDDGLRVIAIGGLSLSRGLTLEGLIVSYFYRNSKMYDTLMQMGRWFGYRKNYEDLCRIWMSEESISWYRNISKATDELRDDIKKYQSSGLTPTDFGLRVRSDINTLLVTARNKMRTAKTAKINISLSGTVIETPNIYTDLDKNIKNKNLVKDLIKKIEKNNGGFCLVGKSYISKNVDKENILELLNYAEISLLNSLFDTESIVKFLKNNKNKELDKWDVVIRSGESKKKFTITGEKEVSYIERSFSLINDNRILKMNSSRLGSSSDGRFGLNESQELECKKLKNNDKTLAQKDYFAIKRKPLFLIYMIDPKLNKSKYNYETNKQFKEKIDSSNEPLIGFSIGIPNLDNLKTEYATYTINRIQQALNESEGYDIVGDE